MSRRGFVEALLVVAAALALALVWLRPLPLADHLPVAPSTTIESDVQLWTWGIWWAGEALGEGRNPFFCDRIFHPVGHGLTLHTHGMLWMVAGVPIAHLGGVALAHNVMLFVVVALAALGTWALARDLGLGRTGSAFATFGWVFAPYFMQKAYFHLCFVASPWPPLALLFLVRWMRAERPRAALGSAVGTGLAFGLCTLTSTTVTLYLVLTAALVVIVAPVPPRAAGAPRRRGLRWPLPWLAGIAVSVVVALPFLVEATREVRSILRGEEGRPRVELEHVVSRGTMQPRRFVEFFGLAERHPLSPRRSALLREDPEPDDPWEGRGLTLSCALLALALALSTRPTGARRWLAIGFVLFLLAWNPGSVPSELYRSIPPFGAMRFSTRVLPFALLALALAAGLGARELVRARRGRWLVPAGALLVFESWVAPFEVERVEIPPAVEQIARSPHPGAVLVIPFDPGARQPMLWQTVHERPVLVTYLARTNPFVLGRLVSSYPGLARIHAPILQADGSFWVPPVASVARELDAAGVDHVLLRPGFVGRPALERVEALLAALPGWERKSESEDLIRWGRSSQREVPHERDQRDR